VATKSLRFDELPRTIPVFPLTGVLLLPRGRLPLNIFEPRYLRMLEDARKGNGLIGMIQPAKADTDMQDAPALYRVGCLGTISEYAPAKEGRFRIALAGVCRFEVIEEMPRTKLYREMLVSYAPYRADFEVASGGFDRKRLVRAMEGFFKLSNLKVDWSAVAKAPDDALVSALAMMCPFAPPEKQALLEATSLGERAEIVTTLMEMALASRSASTAFTRQ
jgi:Lon protease-like protein